MENSLLIQIGLPIALIIIMAGMGMTLSPRDFRNIGERPGGFAWGAAAQLFVLPLLSIPLAILLKLPPEIAVGLVIIAACPGGTTSNFIAYLARGNLALSIALTVVASLAVIVTLPLFVNLALGIFADTDAQVRLPVLQTVAMLVIIILLPVSFGMLVRVKAPGFAARFERMVGLFGGIVLLAMIIAICIKVADQLLAIITSAGIGVMALSVLGIGIALLGARLFRLPADQAITIAVELGLKNATLGLLVSVTLLQSPTMAAPSALYGVTMYAFGALLVAYGRRRIPAA